MKLFYYRDPVGNFGDDLNPWIWYTLAPEIFNSDDSDVLVGIGTLIDTLAPVEPRKFVFGSGVGYHKLPVLDDKWQFYCVRGPLSAARLGLDKSYAMSDPAVLLTQVVSNEAIQRTNMVTFMPHHGSTRFADWKDICRQAGMNYIDPAADVHEAVLQIRQSRLVIAEAMHGAIVADAFRVPWVPVACYDHILDFKWNDWCQSLGLTYEPEKLPRLWDMETGFSLETRIKTRIKRSLRDRGIWSDNWSPPVPRTNKAEVEGEIVTSLVRFAENGHQFLSEDRYHQESISHLLETLEQVRKDWS